MIHDAALVAPHVQSRVVATDRLPDPPDAGIEAETEFVTATWHFAAVGALTSIEEEPHPAQPTASAHARNSRARIRRADVQKA